jgi:DNA polymerase (family X)
VAQLLDEQGANPYRVQAYRNAAQTLPQLDRPITEILQHNGIDGLRQLPGIGESLAHSIHALATTGRLPMLEQARGQAGWSASDDPAIEELLDVDREYREKAAAGRLRRIAPRRFNPSGEAWLPVLHNQRAERHYMALFSNTAWAHQMDMASDWVVLYYGRGRGERQCTVITSQRDALKGKRIVRGREAEYVQYSQQQKVPVT